VRLAGQRAFGRTLTGRLLGDLVDKPPQPPQEAGDPLDALLGPLHVLVGGAHEEDVEPHGVRAVLLGELIRRRHVPARLRHLRAATGGRTSDTARSATPRSRRAAACLWAGSPPPPAEAPAARSRERGRSRPRRNRRSESDSPSNAAARSPSRGSGN